jgi:uroporphyrin-III C-methyltransferase/precorrin-2 dehydrogenase/sirohydrochlorin ferrochelatase
MIDFVTASGSGIPMRYFPVFMDLLDQQVLIVGGGAVAARKAKLLARAGARILIAARETGDEINEMIRDGRVVLIAGVYRPDLMKSVRLVFAATSDRVLNRRVFHDAERFGVPVNVVDDPELCRFISPAVIDRSPVQVAVSSGGASPVLARHIRTWIEAILPDGIGRIASVAGKLRDEVRLNLSPDKRRAFWESMLSDRRLADWSSLTAVRIDSLVRRELQRFSGRSTDTDNSAGKVYLVGAGPGNPGLLTLKALQVMAGADVVLHDRLVSDDILDRVRRDARLIDVGKRTGNHHRTQRQIEQLLVDEARKGKTVVRLKGGDPFIFGRGGEELQHLRRNKIDYEVVPGVTAAAGCAAWSGIPLTHRDHAQVLSLVTGHRASADSGGSDAVDWAGITGPGRTVVVYMGVGSAGTIRQQMLEAGISSKLPAALVTNGTLDNQQVISGNVGSLPGMALKLKGRIPGLFIVGEVAALSSALGWVNATIPPGMGFDTMKDAGIKAAA